MSADDLYAALVRLCQDFGHTTEATYDALHSAVHSIALDPEDLL